ncbi:MAG: proline--tRNA ligase [Thermoproteota archaeon]|uniref:Proline--tRNA ligase n=4 Tax=environmental samples TaxID=651140 RepID=A0A075H3R3_9ARCH|nr:prolyl-tRNA synthetase (PARS, proS) [uncultured marine thaumarchaeote KM3_183_D02]AIF05512.1 prolyl-tRNA synthetase (PARS, proS) [uncultured marine thaumarchaeote KM3_183_D03]AIF09830.1 prolyl-tRNA synthetase (PARS, proS) [uncultured marine thaumarchaeote KM3_41_D10]AIF13739.1 prolyl-tRNA synthetase (PARS, proS) [uncultured marine thaumarchaeote KM3_64_A03]MEA2043904.1 proline--tRNA ligase [Thermoproteota archaeon]
MSKEVGITVSKSENFSEWYTQVVIKAELADYAPVKGLIVLRPDGYSIWESIKESLDKKLKETGHRNGFLPVLIPESLLAKEKEHFEGLNPEVFWVTHSGNSEIGDRLALRPTSETLAYSLFSKWIRSWRDLPLKINFWNSALRAEIKGTKPFLRTSEFLWQEGHTVHTTKDEAEKEVADILELYKKTIEEELAVPVVTGKKSEKDKFVGAVYTDTLESLMPDGKALQMGTSHFLGENFSKPFDVKYLDENNVETFAWQTSWGVSWRLIGGMIMTHGDDKGLVLPPKVAPIQVVIIPIYYSKEDKENVLQKACQIKDSLSNNDIRVHLDDREQLTPGFKFNDWEMKGIPIRIEIGPKDIAKNQIVLARRHNQTKISLDIDGLTEKTLSELKNIQMEMFDAAKKILDERVVRVSEYQQFKKEVENGKMIDCSWCGNQTCEDKIKEETGADLRVIPSDNTKAETCIYCKNSGTTNVLFARGY